MANPETPRIISRLSTDIAVHVPHFPIETSVWIESHGADVRQRVEEFDAVHQDMVRLVERGGAMPILGYDNLNAMRDVLRGNAPLSINEAVQYCLERRDDLGDPRLSFLRAVVKTYQDVDREFAAPEPSTFTMFPPLPHGQIVTRALLQGYGTFVEKYYHAPGLGPTVSRAMQEIIFMRFGDTQIFRDILPWMKGHPHDFSGRVQRLLHQMPDFDR